MKFFEWSKDGGPESKVWGFFLVEIKPLFSIVLLKFERGSREAYHNHAFNAVSWVLKGQLVEFKANDRMNDECHWPAHYHLPSWRPVLTTRDNMHMVVSWKTSWAISFRGPWAKTWTEYIPKDNSIVKLTHGRKEI